MKKTVSFLLALAMTCGSAFALTACDNKPDEPNNPNNPDNPNTPTATLRESIVKGAWESEVYGDESHVLQDDVVFHDDGIFYTTSFGGANQAAGYWTLTEEEKALTYYADYELTDDDAETYTFPAYVTLTKFNGDPYTTNDEVMDEFKEQGIYGIKDDVLYGVMYQAMRFYHKPNKTVNEIAITVDSFFNGEEAYSLDFGHNGKYEDFITGELYSGTWKYNSATRTYTLTDTTGGGTATVVVSEDGNTAVYKRGDQEITITNINQAVPVVATFEGTAGKILLYVDNTCTVTIFGTKIEGTWSVEGGVYTLDLGERGKLVSEVNENGFLQFVHPQAGSFVIVAKQMRLVGKFLVFSVPGEEPGTTYEVYGDIEVFFYTNGKVDFHSVADLTDSGMGVVEYDESGTWVLNEDETITVTISADKTYTMSKNADGKYVLSGYKTSLRGVSKDADDLVQTTIANPQVIFKGEGSMAGGAVSLSTTITLFDDGSATFVTETSGYVTTTIAELGTWELNTTTYQMIITIPVADGDDRVFIAAPVDQQGTYKFTYSFVMNGSTVEVEMTKVALDA